MRTFHIDYKFPFLYISTPQLWLPVRHFSPAPDGPSRAVERLGDFLPPPLTRSGLVRNCTVVPYAEKYSDSMYIKLALIIEQMDSSSALKPLKLRTTNAGIQNGLYCAICARFDWSSHEDRSLVLCLGWFRGYLQGHILGAYREYQSVHLIRL
jgi:hypothetical protein